MQTSINYPPDAKGKWSLPILLAMISLAVSSFFVSFPPSKSRLLNKLTSCLREEKFERLYDELRPDFRQRVSRANFVGRMKAVAAKLKAVDPELKFQKDEWTERLYSQEESSVLTSAQRLTGGGKSVQVLIIWDSKGSFHDMSLTPEYDTPKEYGVFSVTLRYREPGGQWMND